MASKRVLPERDEVAGVLAPPAAPSAEALAALLPSLQRLDILLERAVVTAAETYGPEAVADPFRGLHLDQRECERLLRRSPGTPTLCDGPGTADPPCPAAPQQGPLRRVADLFGLADFDVDVLLIALAPELDLRYERLYAFLLDHVTSKRPTVDLALNLLCRSAAEKVARRAHFHPAAPLIRAGLIDCQADQHDAQPPLIASPMRIGRSLTQYLLGQPGLDTRLAAFCELQRPDASLSQVPIREDLRSRLRTSFAGAAGGRRTHALYFRGRPGVGRRRAASGLAYEVGALLLVADLRDLQVVPEAVPVTIRTLYRDALLVDAVLYVTGLDDAEARYRSLVLRCLTKELATHRGLVVFAGTGGSPVDITAIDGVPIQTVDFPPPDFAQRRTHWNKLLTEAGIQVASQDVDALAGRFRLTFGEIERAVAEARRDRPWRNGSRADRSSSPPARVTTAWLFEAARGAAGSELGLLARRREPRQSWPDLVLPDDQTSQLREICDQASHRHTVYGTWGFSRKLSLGLGLNILFAGPPGTGKTMAAEVIAGELQLGLYTIDLASVVSKYIGETEKNLDRIFTSAEWANAILLFDEADALFGKRSEIRDAHDRYANIEVGYLLQKMDEYEGIAILATNVRHHLDEAFLRRMHAVVEFPLPDEDLRRRIWEVIFPREAPLDPVVDLALLARDVKVAGGNIRNIALAAAFLAAADGQVIRMAHLVRAVRREHQKLGRTWREPDWDVAAATVASNGPAPDESRGRP
jgi:hypothetical protein